MLGLESRIVFFIAAVIFLLVLSYFIIKIGGKTISEILAYLGVVKLSNIEKATLCSIYRCTEGCLSMKVQEISWKEGEKTVYCNDFCKDGYDPSDKYARICGRNFPVTLKLSSPERLVKDHFKIDVGGGFKEVGCILPTDAALDMNIVEILKYIFGGVIWKFLENVWKTLTGQVVGNSWIIVENSIIRSYGTREDCVDDNWGLLTHQSLKEVEIKPKIKINISVEKFEFFNFKNLIIFLSSG